MSDDAVRPRRALAPDDSAEAPEARVENPFARPGSEASSEPAPRPRRGAPAEEVDNSYDDTVEVPRVEDPPSMIPAPVLPQRGDGFFDGPSPRPRRSALSSSTPPEVAPSARADVRTDADRDEEVVPPPGSSSPDEHTTTLGSPAHGPSPSPNESAEPEQSWVRAHATMLVASVVAVVLMAAGAGWFGYSAARSAGEATSSPSPSPTASNTPQVPRASQADLLNVADVKAISPNATWAITGTTTSIDAHTARSACLSTDPASTDRIDSLQRALGTTEANRLAALHQLDAYPNEQLAKEAFQARLASMTKCDEIQTLLLGASRVEGLGDESTQITVAEESEKKVFHTVLLTRTGNVLSLIDVARTDSAVQAETVVNAATRSASALCKTAGKCQPEKATVGAGTVPPADPLGWLITSDLPRVHPNAGLWNAKPPAALSSRGTGCENLTLASEGSPKERRQATYLMTQDDKTPEQFGLDEMVFRFGDANNATNFATKLQEGLGKCQDRVPGTKVRTIKSHNDSKAYEITRKTDDGEVIFQVAVVRNNANVAYLLATVTDDYRFSDQHVMWLTQRTSARLGQF